MPKRILPLAAAMLLFGGEAARAFCGFYVAGADGTVFNKASKVVLAHHGNRTVITMASDVSGSAKNFALVIPVPTVITRSQVKIAHTATIDHLDAYSGPRLVEYYDNDPCPQPAPPLAVADATPAAAPPPPSPAPGVRIEAQYSVGEYDIIVLGADDSAGLLTWLNAHGYKVPAQAEPIVRGYLRQNMHFFLAKVNLKRLESSGSQFLEPIQVTYASPKFMLPLRLGTVNADGPQELLAYALTQNGRVESTNYRTVKMPSGIDVPLYVKDEFGPVYKALFDHQVEAEHGTSVFLEYAWNMNNCDPCSAEPLSHDELQELGVDWIQDGGQNAFLTRLHVRYDSIHFPEDLMLQETADTESYQARYVLRHPFLGPAACSAGRAYQAQLPQRYDQEASNLAELTGWQQATIRAHMHDTAAKYYPQGTP